MLIISAKDKKKLSSEELAKWKELDRMLQSVDMSRFWQEVVQAAAPGIEEYRIARAKSKAQAASTVFI